MIILEVLPVKLETEKETLLLVIVYRVPGPLGTFIDDFILFINELPTQRSILIVGDFNLDQMLPENVAKVDPLIQNFNLSQHSQYSTHIQDYWILHLILQSSFLFLLYHHSTAITLPLFSKSDRFIYIEFSFH